MKTSTHQERKAMTAAKKKTEPKAKAEVKKPDLKALAMALEPAQLTQEQKDQAAKDFKAVLPGAAAPDLRTVPLSALRPSDQNLRKKFHGIEELAASIESLGRLITPLTVRPIEGTKTFEIIAGGRRYLALKRLGWKDATVEVADFSDAQVAEIMLVENLQREDLHALEEAEGYERLQKDRHFTVAQIAAKIGKSKGHVHARIKLLALGPEARKAFLTPAEPGKPPLLHPTVAVALARISSHKHQVIALQTINPKGAEPMTTRQALEFLQKDFARTLKGAPFNQNDDMLVPKQMKDGVVIGGSCAKCPYKSGSTPGLFEDISGHDTCTHPPCYDLKKDASWKASSAAAEKRGLEVLGVAAGRAAFSHNNELHQMSALVLAGAPADGDPKKRTWKQLVAKLPEDKQPNLLFVPDRQLKGRECFDREAVLKALAKDQKWAAKEIKTSAKLDQTDDHHWEKERDQRAVRDRVLQVIIDKAIDGVDELRLPELRIMALGELSDAGSQESALVRRGLDDKTVEKWVTEKATAKELSNFLYEFAIVKYLGSTWNGYTDEADAFAKRLKIDVKAQEKIFAAEAAAIAKADAEKKAAEDLMSKAEPGSPLKVAAGEAEQAQREANEDF